MATPRTRVAAATVLQSWDGVDTALRELGEITRRITACEAAANTKIDDIRQKLADATSEDLARKARLETDIKAFTEAKEADLEGRSRKLNFGTVFLRRTTKVACLPKWTFAKVLETLKKATRYDFIRTKEEVDKEAVLAAKLSDDDMAKLGMRVMQEDSFSYELAVIEAQATD